MQHVHYSALLMNESFSGRNENLNVITVPVHVCESQFVTVVGAVNPVVLTKYIHSHTKYWYMHSHAKYVH